MRKLHRLQKKGMLFKLNQVKVDWFNYSSYMGSWEVLFANFAKKGFSVA